MSEKCNGCNEGGKCCAFLIFGGLQPLLKADFAEESK